MTAVIVGYARTPFVKFNGAFASVPATELGAHAISAALARAGVAVQALKIAPLPIAPLPIAGRGGPTLISVDDGLRASTTVETLAALHPAFGESGTLTAGTSSQIADGAAAIVLMSSTAADALGITTLPPWSRTLSLPARTCRCTRNRRTRLPLLRWSGRPRPSHRSIRCSYRRAPRSSACCPRLWFGGCGRYLRWWRAGRRTSSHGAVTGALCAWA